MAGPRYNRPGRHGMGTAAGGAGGADGAGPSGGGAKGGREEHHVFYVGGSCADRVLLYHALSHFMRRLRNGEQGLPCTHTCMLVHRLSPNLATLCTTNKCCHKPVIHQARLKRGSQAISNFTTLSLPFVGLLNFALCSG